MTRRREEILSLKEKKIPKKIRFILYKDCDFKRKKNISYHVNIENCGKIQKLLAHLRLRFPWLSATGSLHVLPLLRTFEKDPPPALLLKILFCAGKEKYSYLFRQLQFHALKEVLQNFSRNVWFFNISSQVRIFRP